MIRNYNGNINRAVIRDLKRLCKINVEDEQNLFEAFYQNGKVGVYENLDFFGCPDEMSTVVELGSEEEIKKYLKKHLKEKIEGYLRNNKYAKDYLISSIVKFISTNGRFPYQDEMKNLEKESEAKRIKDLPKDSVDVKKEITVNDIALEILQFAEEIMEARRESNPDDIHMPPEPYPYSLHIEAEKIMGNIFNYVDRVCTDFMYGCVIGIKDKKYKNICPEKISIEYGYDGTPVVSATNYFDEKINKDITKPLIIIHKAFVEMAKQIELEFTSEIDYKKFV